MVSLGGLTITDGSLRVPLRLKARPTIEDIVSGASNYGLSKETLAGRKTMVLLFVRGTWMGHGYKMNA